MVSPPGPLTDSILVGVLRRSVAAGVSDTPLQWRLMLTGILKDSSYQRLGSLIIYKECSSLLGLIRPRDRDNLG